jgi:hypothetical protein
MKPHQHSEPRLISGARVTTCALATAILALGIAKGICSPRPPLPPLPSSGLIHTEDFDQPSRMPSDQVPDPTVWAESWSGYCLDRNSSNVVPWAIPMAGPDRAWVDPATGAIRFWYRPSYDTGTGPGRIATLLTLVSANNGGTLVWWTLAVLQNATNLCLFCQDGGNLVPCLSAATAFQAGAWTLITLCYSETNCAIFINDTMAAAGGGLPALPAQIVPYTSLIVGSRADGLETAAGQIEELYCFSGSNPFRRMAASPFGLSLQWDIADYWAILSPVAALGPITPEEEAAQAQLRAQRRAARQLAALNTPMGLDGPEGDSVPCGTNHIYNVWITNTVSTNILGQGWTVAFTIAGGTNGAIYDVFRASTLTSPITNATWLWLTNGHACDRITLTNQPADGNFYILGTPLDSDNGGLTDAYERLITHGDLTDPADDRPMPPGMSVAILDSQLTRTHWSSTNWNYFLMPESVKEALRSDGTPFTVVGDTTIAKGLLLTNDEPRYPILISLAAEAIGDDEIGPLTNYVAKGGFLLVGSSSFTRDSNGNRRSTYPFSAQMGITYAAPTNWLENEYLAPVSDHRLVRHIPQPWVVWRMPTHAEEISWGTCDDGSPYGHDHAGTHLIWPMSASSAQVLATGDYDRGTNLYVAIKPYGKGYFIYHAAMQPLVGHGGFAPTMHAYMVFRKAIAWAFENAGQRPVAKLSPWPYDYNAAFMVRHDFENYSKVGDRLETLWQSAQYEHLRGVKGDYYFSTGCITNEGVRFDVIMDSLHEAVTNYGATIGPHNGGLENPRSTNNLPAGCALPQGPFTYEYFHWGPDEALGVTPPSPYTSGKAYAAASMTIAFEQIETWLPNLQSGPRLWVSPYFNATREDSLDIQEKLGVKITGDQKLSPFPHWTLSTRTPGKHYSFLSEPVSDWFVSTRVAQSLEPWEGDEFKHTTTTMHAGVDLYYTNGFLINFYSHTGSDGQGDAGQLVPDYISYCLGHSNIWAANAKDVYHWWVDRSAAHISASYATNGAQIIATVDISGATNTNTAVEFFVHGAAEGLQVLRNGSQATTNDYRIFDEVIKVHVGTSVTNVQVTYTPAPKPPLPPNPQNDSFVTNQNQTLSVPAPGVLVNDLDAVWTNLTASVISYPASGTLNLTNNGGFSYKPNTNFFGRDCFTYRATEAGGTNSGVATVTILVTNTDVLFHDNFKRCALPYALAPLQVLAGQYGGTWSLTGDALQGAQPYDYGYCYLGANWSNYWIEAKIAIPAGACGGGIGGRLDPLYGAHYAAWVYPEASGCASNVLRLVKFNQWDSWGYKGTNQAPMAAANLAAVGTGYHTLKLSFTNTNYIEVFFDGTKVISMADEETQHPVYQTGGMTVDVYGGTLALTNLLVMPLP